jgi:glycosyltransferase involved in cell wall biosynthesis
MENRHRTRPNVLFVVNLNRTTGIAIEVANNIDRERYDLRTIVYYRSTPNITFPVSAPPIEIGARGRLDLKAIRALYSLIKSNCPDVIHVHHTMSAALASLLGRLLRVPVVVKTEHTDHSVFKPWQNMLNFITLTLSDTVICNSKNTCRSFHWWEKRITESKRGVIYNGVDVAWLNGCAADKAVVRNGYGVAASDFLIGNVGRQVPQKDQESLVRAMKTVVKELPNARLILVGDGPLKPKLETLAHKLGVHDSVIFTGVLQRKSVYELLHAIDVFVMCSVQEGFCNALVEAMAAGKPVVVTEVGPLPEVVGDVGYYVPPRDPDTLAHAILETAALPEEDRVTVGLAARRRVEQRFTVEHTARQYEQLYERMLAEKGWRDRIQNPV